ncbi:MULTISPECIES: flagellar basal body rod protein FlgB [unclassified Campylobacter]|uniref:flagellar basal body rod protein FlgB n=1 Tax=unclassified Campylobacter TaxID=2593542 RepID=UPI001237E78C|nr:MULTISPECIES: flagellar basal body rod protein FlgB [unclassified Campylobacter]KAA6225520.1 flagellar basal body rod protein FlgB [Campylobacter sp. LR196d]KAA6226957.1 flagellar basal body rod protein FlgB [Campylobacter sp. LR185c]KAA6229791.1 flagellar basal body rod protein FlgB [Campylobacter sp. LR286c]KAA6234316.1 flagellar basal body rod protein FlgB [Campylobacter sp. LR291e]KAA6234535.1 flagellar basal body rod protein FlgB [Campylobacter sp. LR264d]
MINPFKSKELVVGALAGRNLRNQVINSNLANVDTPFYKARDIEFETALVNRANEIFKKGDNKELKLANTDENHQQPWKFPDPNKSIIYLRDGHLARNDANTVDLDVETTEMSKNTTMITALDGVLRRQGNIFTSIIDASSKI